MKRMILVAMATLVAGMIQAGTIAWGTNGTITDNTGAILIQGDAYLVDIGASTTYTWGSGTIVDTAWQNVNNPVTGQAPGIGNVFAATGNGTLPSGMQTTVPVSANNHFVIVFTTVDTTGALSLPTTGYWGVSQTYLQLATDDSGTQDLNPGLLSNSVQTSNPVAVPEPCTMALVLMGAGAMAVRRRFAKKS